MIHYYYFIDEELDIVYAAPFDGYVEALTYRDDVLPDHTVAVRVKERNID